MKNLFLLFSFAICINGISSAQTILEEEVEIPLSPLTYEILAIAGDCTAYDNVAAKQGPVKGAFASPVYVPFDNTSGYIVVGSEENKNDDNFGDGGGVTQFKVQKDQDNKWSVAPQSVDGKNVYFRNVNTASIGGTIFNSGLSITLNDRILVSEDWLQASNAQLKKSDTASATAANSGTRLTPPYTIPAGTGVAAGKSVPRYQNMNWMFEINPTTAAVTKKHYTTGRFGHAHAVVYDDNRIYMSSSTSPSVLFKFESVSNNNFTNGELFAYKQNDNGLGGTWISLSKETSPGSGIFVQDFDSLLIAQQVALKAGATMFFNLSGMTLALLYGEEVLMIAEKGMDHSGDIFTNPAKKFKGTLAKHLVNLDGMDGSVDGLISDIHGRILALNTNADHLTVFMEGGPATQGSAASNGYVLSNPDKLSIIRVPNQSKNYLVIHEDVNGLSNGRNPIATLDMSQVINETYWVEMVKYDNDGIEVNPTVNDLNLFLVGPKGAEITGGDYNLQNDTYFISIQNPNPTNAYPWNKSMVLALKGTDQYILTYNKKPEFRSENSFQMWPNPASRILFLNKTTDIEIYDMQGILIKSELKTDQIDIMDLHPGMYIVRTAEGASKKLIVR